MKRQNKIYCAYAGFISVCIFLCAFTSMAQQDNHLSQFFASPMTLNPAATGMFEGNYRANIQYRNQWRSLVKNSFVTQNVAFDMPKKKFGLGASIQNNKAGSGGFSTLACLFSGAYEITTDAAEIHHLTTGVQVGFINKSVDISKLTFDAQYSTANGGGFDPNISSQEVFQKTSFFIPDLNFGVYYYNVNREKIFNPYFGVSGFHLTTPNESVFGNDKNSLPIRYVIHGGTKIKVTELIDIEPSFAFMEQAKIRDVNFGASGSYFFTQSNARALFGVYYRNKDAIILHTGFIYKEYSLGMSYDINTSALSSFTNGRGGFEISIIYKKKNAQYVPSINSF